MIGPEKYNKSILIICADVIGPKMAGTGIRALEMAKAASKRYVTTLAAKEVRAKESRDFTCIESRYASVREAAERADIIIIQGDTLRSFPFLRKSRAILIADMYCPVLLEYHQSSVSDHIEEHLTTVTSLSDIVLEQLIYADYFLYASDRQRDFWFGALALSGRINRLRFPDPKSSNIDDILIPMPFGISEAVPKARPGVLRERFGIRKDHYIAIWGGGVYEWFDPLVIINAIDYLVANGLNMHLVFMGVKHPNAGVTDHDMLSKAIRLAKDLGLYAKFVHFNFGWTDYEDRYSFLMDADIGVSAHFNTPETRFAFRTRMLDYIWSGLPMISSRGDYFGDLVESRNLGISVGFDDRLAWGEAMRRMILDKEFKDSCVQQVKQLKQEFYWGNLFEVLDERMPSMKVSPDRTYARIDFGEKLLRGRSILLRVKAAYRAGGLRHLLSSVLRKVRVNLRLE